MKAGTPQTREFYDEHGWREKDGVSLDADLFGVKEDGPIRIELHRARTDRVRASLRRAGEGLELLECGCGGNPARELMDLCAHYTGVDFSETGIERARAAYEDSPIPTEFHVADVCALPFEDESFDAVYSAHMIYHIDDRAAQRAALDEMIRLLRPGGVAVIVTANPRPLLSPGRLARRLIADTPVVGELVDGMRARPPLPYSPRTIRWMKRHFEDHGTVEVSGYSIPTTAFYQGVTEHENPGKLAWQLVRSLELRAPHLSAYLGNYVTVAYEKANPGHAAR